jgi:aspartate kinase
LCRLGFLKFFLSGESMIVMKFGGSSVKDAVSIGRVIKIIQEHLPLDPVIVVSAMGKTTRNLLGAGALASEGKTGEALGQLAAIEAYHHAELLQLVEDHRNFPVFSLMAGYFSEMHALIKALSILKEFSLRSQDAVAGYGELLSSAILAAGLESREVKVQLLDSRTLMITDDHFTAAEPIERTAQARMCAALLPELERGRTPVMQGYIGATLAGAPTTLGFEGSDFTATFVGAALDAKAIQIWKDVPGLMSADPAVIPDAQTIPAATCDEMAELTYFGAKLLHPRAVWPAAQKRIPVHIVNSWRPQDAGTIIQESAVTAPQGVRSIAFKRGLALLHVVSNRQQPISAFMKGVLDVLDRHRVTPDLTAISSMHCRLALDANLPFERFLPELHRLGAVEIERGKACICLVGQGLTQQPGIAALALGAVSDLRLDLISQGSSPNSLMMVFDETHLETGLKRVHRQFFERDP